MARPDLSNVTFGTDGWRDIIADGFTVERVRWVAQAVADWLKKQKPFRGKALVGYDGRFAGERFALAAGRVLAGNGFRTDVTRTPVPTPAISWWIMKKHYAGGLMITASHNPAAYSGIKIKPHFGGSADESIIEPIAASVGLHSPKSADLEKVRRVCILEQYTSMLRSFLELPALRRLRGRIVFDAMGGASAGLLQPVLRGLPVQIIPIHDAIDANFFGLESPEPVEKHLAALKEAVRSHRALVGIATDGDGDRVGIVSDDGEFLTPHKVFSLLVLHMVRNRRQTGAVVKTVSGSFLLDRIAAKQGLTLLETPVGFKYICKLMREHDIIIGGEESGGVGFKGYLPERDGLMSGLLFLELLGKSGKTCSQLTRDLRREFGESHYGRIDTHHSRAQAALRGMIASPPERIAGMKVVKANTRDGLKLIFPDDSWLLFRASGTEPLLRIYSETRSPALTRRLLKAGARLAGISG